MSRRLALFVAATLLCGLVFVAPAGASGNLPAATNDLYNGRQGETLTVAARAGVLRNDIDPEGDALIAQRTWGPFNGTLDLRPNGGFTYVPNPGWSGYDSFIYAVFDGTGWTSATATLRIMGKPVTAPDTYQVQADSGLQLLEPGPLTNDYDTLGLPLRKAVIVDGADHGFARLLWNGTLRYRPDPGFVGWDEVTYRVENIGGYRTRGTIRIQVKGGENAPPVAVDDHYDMYEDNVLSDGAPGLLANDYDPDVDDYLTVEHVSGPSAGEVELFEDGSFNYTPLENFDSPDSFRYRVCDGTTCSAPATVFIEITAVNDPPYGEDDYFGVNQDTVSFIGAPGVLANDYDPIEGDTLFVGGWGAPGSGTLVGNPDGSFTYTPEAGFTGWDSFSYTVCDSGGCASASVSIEVFASEELPP
jgi:hypothetical protein